MAPAKKRPAAAPAAKVLITAAALSATLAGWAGLAASESETSTTTPVPVVEELSPIPTLIPASADSAPVTAPAPQLSQPASQRPTPITRSRSSR